ncbi:MAG: lactate utilization protein [Chloroflexi bacterium]|nr:lactate utilization protein [Chloroflexota bacterium]
MSTVVGIKAAEWSTLASDEVIDRTRRALEERGIRTLVVKNRAQALVSLRELIPPGASVMTGGSTTLDQIGFTDYLVSRQHPWKNLKDAILAETDMEKQAELRRQATLADYYVGSVQAIAENGEVLNCDATGTRVGPYAYGPRNVIWVVGVQKITKDLEQALRRMREYCVPLEDQRMKSIGYPGTTLSRVLIYEKTEPDRITAVLVKEQLGF